MVAASLASNPSGLAMEPAEILLVEDNPADVALTREALSEKKVFANLRVVRDGVEALQYLRGEAGFRDRPRPDIVLLDLNLPRKPGHEVLREIRADPNLAGLPVVILTTSAAEEDVVRAYNLKVNCYVTKPVDFDEFVKVVHSVGDFWFTIVRLPHRAKNA